MTEAKPATAPTDKSNPLTVRDMVTANAIKATIDIDLKMFVMLVRLRKLSRVIEKKGLLQL